MYFSPIAPVKCSNATPEARVASSNWAVGPAPVWRAAAEEVGPEEPLHPPRTGSSSGPARSLLRALRPTARAGRLPPRAGRRARAPSPPRGDAEPRRRAPGNDAAPDRRGRAAPPPADRAGRLRDRPAPGLPRRARGG